ncbi:MAG: hypothetical protein IJ545_04605 [Alphaproteobacteria bacterium]|nr:hypothetical protein [Alphaproteobacteria bacterium]
MTKVTIANYLINNLSDRFPFSQSGFIDHNAIDVMIQNWDHNLYPVFEPKQPEQKSKQAHKRILM